MNHFSLDMTTIFFTVVIGHLFTAVLVGAVRLSNKKDVSIHTYFIAKCFQMASYCLLTIRGGIPDVFTISIANSLLFIGNSLEIIAVLRLLNLYQSRTKKIYGAITSLNLVGFHMVLWFANEVPYRIAFASIGTAVLLVPPAYHMMKSNRSLLTRMIGSFYLLIFLLLVIRALMVLSSDLIIDYFTPGVFQTISLFTLFMVMMLGNTGFFLLMREKMHQELIHLTNYDELTNILNRRAFIARATSCLVENARKKKPISLILFDVDYFKEINDSYGHYVGDKVLQHLSTRIQEILDEKCLFGRYGGDEFAVLLPEGDEITSTQYAEEIRDTIGKSDKFQIQYTLSMGVLTIMPTPNTTLEELYILSDQALYEAKRKGRNCIYRHKTEHLNNF